MLNPDTGKNFYSICCKSAILLEIFANQKLFADPFFLHDHFQPALEAEKYSGTVSLNS